VEESGDSVGGDEDLTLEEQQEKILYALAGMVMIPMAK